MAVAGGAWHLGWSAAAGRIPRIGLVEAGTAQANQHFVDAFVAGLREQGYTPGKSILLDVRWAEGRAEEFPILLADLQRERPDVIVVSSTLGARAAKRVVSTTPVVFIGVSDPVEAGLVATPAHPGGTFTGLSRVFGEGLLGKAVQMLKDIVPRASRCAILWNTQGDVDSRLREARAALQSLGLAAVDAPLRDPAELERTYAALRAQRADILLVVTDPMTLANRQRIVDLAASERIPAVYEFPEFARAGGLLAYSASIPALFRRAAIFVDKILKGAQPGDLPVEQPTAFELVVNLKAARKLGLTVPQSLLLRADEVIE
jgi:putative ABC transport system substrate-binding protein